MVNANIFVMIADRYRLFCSALRGILAKSEKQPNYDYSTFGYYVPLGYIKWKARRNNG